MLEQAVGHVFTVGATEALAPSQRLHLILLGVDSVERSTAFYEALGWRKSPASNAGFVKFDLGGYALCLIPRADFARDAGHASPQGSGFAGIGLIHIVRSAGDVARVLAKAVEAGGRLVKPATRTHWGVAGYFTDPDGHLFEVDYEGVWVLDDDHRLVVDEINA